MLLLAPPDFLAAMTRAIDADFVAAAEEAMANGDSAEAERIWSQAPVGLAPDLAERMAAVGAWLFGP